MVNWQQSERAKNKREAEKLRKMTPKEKQEHHKKKLSKYEKMIDSW